MIRNCVHEARDVLERVGGVQYAKAEIVAIDDALRLEAPSRSLASELLSAGIRRILLIGIGLAALQQWTGINVIFNYAGDVYRAAGYGANDILLDIVVTGVINLVFTILAMALVDRLGRRPLMILGCLGIGLAHLFCALAYHAGWSAGKVLTLTLSAIACYALTLAPVTWVLIAEIFPNRVRSLAVSVCVGALWTASFLLTYTFPTLYRSFGMGGTFLTYGMICVAGCILCATCVPETKGRSLEQIGAVLPNQRQKK